jgi:pimeloyl-ACP methyl ester carboxylesterase
MHEPCPRLNDTARHHRTLGLAWREWGQGAPLILLHGGTGSWRHWAANIESLAKTRRVLAVDSPGLGESDMPTEPATPQTIAAEIAAGIEALLGPQTPYDIAGFSYGAMLAACTAAIHAPRVKTLTIVGPGALGLPRANVALEKVRSRSGQDRIEANRTNLGIFMLKRPARINEEAIAIQDYNTTAARFKSRGFAHTTALKDAIASLPAPIHVIWGDADVTAAPDIPTRIATIRTARPDARITLIPNAGHWVMWDAPGELETALAAAL